MMSKVRRSGAIYCLPVPNFAALSLRTTVMPSMYFDTHCATSIPELPISLSDNTGILLLCEIAAKPFFEQKDANYNADQDCRAASAMQVYPPHFQPFRQFILTYLGNT